MAYLPYLAAGSLAGGVLSYKAAGGAADVQAQAAQQAAANQMQMFNITRQDQLPFIQAGQNAIQGMYNLTGPGGSMSTMPTSSQIMSQFAPNYQFQLQQGMGQAANAANATGGLVSGNAMQGLNTFAQNFAGNAYQNAFQNYQTGQSNIFNRLASIAGTGQLATGQTQGAGVTTAGNVGNFATSAAAAQAAGQVGQANAIGGMVGDLGTLAYLNSQRKT